ncbi:hypothetical protein CsSME_00014189 [Camellia sinensis var. sinensis]
MAKVKGGSVVSRRSAQQSLAGSSGISKSKVDKSKKNLFKAKKDTDPPIVPPAEYWVDLFDDNGGVPIDFLLGGVEPEKGVETFVPPEFIVHFHVERGTYPYSFPAFEDYTGPKDDFDVWSAAIFRHPLYCEVLAGAKIATAISQCMRIRQEPSWLEFTLSCWSSSSHTFIAQWGETTPTLEDVVVLMGLERLGSANPSVGSLSLNQMAIVGRLEEAVAPAGKLLSRYQNKVLVTSRSRKRPKNTFGGCLRYWFRDLSHQVQGNANDGFIGLGMEWDKWGSVEHLAAFITYWLSRYVLMGRPQDGVFHELFPLAAILASGRPIPLAPLFLGGLYKRLDMYQEGVFSIEKSEPRSASWAEGCTQGSLASIFDFEDKFVARPYVMPVCGVSSTIAYRLDDYKLVLEPGVSYLGDTDSVMVLSTVSGHLPYFVDDRYDVVAYNPLKHLPSPVPSMADCKQLYVYSFLSEELRRRGVPPKIGGIDSPTKTRIARQARGCSTDTIDSSQGSAGVCRIKLARHKVLPTGGGGSHDGGLLVPLGVEDDAENSEDDEEGSDQSLEIMGERDDVEDDIGCDIISARPSLSDTPNSRDALVPLRAKIGGGVPIARLFESGCNFSHSDVLSS